MMRLSVSLAIAATTSFTLGALARLPGHIHRHVPRRQLGSPVEQRDAIAATVIVAGPIVTVYELDGKIISSVDALHGLDDGELIVVSVSPLSSSRSFRPAPTATPSSPVYTHGQSVTPEVHDYITAILSPTSSSYTPMSTPQKAPLEAPANASPDDLPMAPPQSQPQSHPQVPPQDPAKTLTKYPSKTPLTSCSQSLPTTSSEAASFPFSSPSTPFPSPGLNTPFPNGQIPCSEFPTPYGAVAVEYLGLGGWIGLQQTPGYTTSALAIDLIVTGISGQDCHGPGFCSYACPPGYQKTQWPTAQGDVGQSIGGLFCGPNGMLYLSRPEVQTLCEPGAGGVFIQNDLDATVSTCRTDYPGTESMTIPLVSQPGSKNPLTNPNSATYYDWKGMATTAQYYVNPKGFGPADSCLWKSVLGPETAGNWAPLNIGTGQNDKGETFLSIFPNLPTSHAQLDFNVEIIGDVSVVCTYINGVYSSGSTGCTTSLAAGGTAFIRYYQ